jgi:Fic family protein
MKTLQYIWQTKEWPKLTWDNEKIITLLGQCRLAQGKLLARISSIGLNIENLAWAEILTEETVKTSAIEGEKLNPRSVRSSVNKRLGLSTAGIAPEKKAEGLIEILIDASENHSKNLTEKRLFAWHKALFPEGMSGFNEINAGNWRSTPMQVVSGRAGNEKIHYEAIPAKLVLKNMKEFLNWWDASCGSIDGIIRAAAAHFYFVTIHPFEDGNGRIARALTDMSLAQDDKQRIRYYSLSHQMMAERKEYYAQLEYAQKGECEITEWIIWFLGCFMRSIEYSKIMLKGVFARFEFWKKFALVDINERQRKVVNRMLEEYPGSFEGGLNTKKYVSIAKVSRATAFRELDDLVKKNILNPIGRGRSTSYEVNL